VPHCFPKVVNLLKLRQGILQWVLSILVILIVLASLASFLAFVDPALHHQLPYRLWADSQFYLWIAGLTSENPYGLDTADIPGLLSVGGNMLGPMLIAKLLRHDIVILGFNYLVLALAIYYCRKAKPLNTPLFTFLLLINPAVMTSLLTVNKEILSILSAAMLCCYVAQSRSSKLLLYATLSTALLARWEQMALTMIFLTATNKYSPFFRKPRAILLFFVTSATLLYPLVAGSVTALAFGEEGAQGNTVAMFTSMQAHYLYFIAAIPKALLGLFGTIIVFLRPSDLPSTDIYNLMLMPIASLLNLLVIGWAGVARKIRLSDEMTLFATLYAFLFTIPPIALVRYLLPVYMVGALLVASHDCTVMRQKRAWSFACQEVPPILEGR
jgi:hypothetical protein